MNYPSLIHYYNNTIIPRNNRINQIHEGWRWVIFGQLLQIAEELFMDPPGPIRVDRYTRETLMPIRSERDLYTAINYL